MPNANIRPAAITAGIALALMAVLAPAAVFGLIPAGQTSLAAVLLFAVVSLDVIAAVALVPVFRAGSAALAWLVAGVRIVYAAVFAVAVTNLLGTPDVAAFERLWDTGLLIFGIHLLLLALLIYRHRAANWWLAGLVALAGVGYLVDSLLVVMGVSVAFELGAFTFVGEVVLLVWLLVRGGRAPRTAAVGQPA